MTINLTECRAKIERAHELRDALEEMIPSEKKAATPRLPISATLEPTSDYYVFWVKDVPWDFYLRVGVIVGEIVHDLRTALDHLFWQLASHYIGGAIPLERVEGIEFPIESTSLGLSEKKMRIPEIPSSLWTIIEEAQPYKGGNSLNLLRVLSNDDKRRVLKTLLMQAKRFWFAVSASGFHVEWDNSKAEMHLKVSAEVTRIKFTPYSPFAQEEVAAYLVPHVLLPKGDRPVVLGLSEIISEVKKVVNDLTVHLQQLGLQG